jgi:hypothetical protein
MWLMEMMLSQDEHGLGEKTIPQGENGARRRCHRCSKMKMGTREMKGMGLERTFFIEKIELNGLREKVILVGTLPSIKSHLIVS